MKRKTKFPVCQLAVIAMTLFVAFGCNDDDTGPNFDLNLEVNPLQAGSVTGAGSYPEGERLSIAATANEGQEFFNWTGDTDYVDDPSLSSSTVTMPAKNITLTANFREEGSDVIYGDGVSDIDGNQYITVIIGDQEWMAENLRVTQYNNGDAIPSDLSDSDWRNTTAGAYAIYDHNASDTDGINSPEEMVDAYGKLYNWYAAANPRGLCPEGWSLPSHDEWTQLERYLCNALGNANCDEQFPYDNTTTGWGGTNEANALKSCRQVNSPLPGCNTSEHPRWAQHFAHHGFDEYGFSALPGGHRRSFDSGFFNLGGIGFYWSVSEPGVEGGAWSRGIYSNNPKMSRSYFNKREGYSVRCVRDAN